MFHGIDGMIYSKPVVYLKQIVTLQVLVHFKLILC